MNFVTKQTFKYIKTSKEHAETGVLRLLHMNCEPTKEDKPCKQCDETWSSEKAIYCYCNENGVHDHHYYCTRGMAWANDVESFKSEQFEIYEIIMSCFDSIRAQTEMFLERFEQCDIVQSPDHFQSIRTKKCAQCIIEDNQ